MTVEEIPGMTLGTRGSSSGRPIMGDLFSGGGGAAKGYKDAGFYVVGIDIEDHSKDYAGDEFIQADAMSYPLDGFDVVHGSPPCQMYSDALKHMSAPQPMLIEPLRERFQASGLPWVIENVAGAPLVTADTLDGAHGVELCGTSFGLRILRHRLFETSFSVKPLPCRHRGNEFNPHNVAGRERMYAEFGRHDPEKRWLAEMGVGWMSRYVGREAIPPVFTEYIGKQLLKQLKVAA